MIDHVRLKAELQSLKTSGSVSPRGADTSKEGIVEVLISCNISSEERNKEGKRKERFGG